jgi:negative regulator of sigma E activity
MTDDLTDAVRDRLRSLDPARGSAELAPSQIQQLKEHAMNAQPVPASSTSLLRRRLPILAAAAALVAVAGVAGAQLVQDDDPAPDAAPDPVVNLDLTVPGGDAVASCIAFDEAVLAQMSPALKATATEVAGDTVTLRVDEWYAGAEEAGNADQVTLTSTSGTVALDGAVTFAEGRTYLITAAEGVVNSCGFSGEATPELEAAFERAFGG